MLRNRDLLVELRADVRAINTRLDGINARLDTLIDSVADVKRELVRHIQEGHE